MMMMMMMLSLVTRRAAAKRIWMESRNKLLLLSLLYHSHLQMIPRSQIYILVYNF